ncbi:hypothetical protein V6N13_052518 [Hibiscus sabdariffa]
MTPITSSPTKQLSLELNAAQTLSVLERCSKMEELKQIHAHMFKTGLVADTILVSKVLTFCVSPKYGNLEHAQKVFDRVNTPNTFMYNTMIKGYSENKSENAFHLYQQMLHLSVPHNSYTFPFLLKACSSLSAMEETKQIHAHVIKFGFGSEVYAVNSLLHVYASSGSIEAARLLFDQVSERDIVSWNSMVDGYAKCGKMEAAYEFFKNTPTKNVISWTTMISGYVGAGMYKEALDLFQEMQLEGVEPDKFALASTLSACSYLGALDHGRWIHAYIDKMGIVIDPVLGCALIDMFAKCGDMEEALKVFKKVKKREVSLWTSLIYGFAIHGRGGEALDWFENMQKVGIKPNHVTFTAILTACSYSGLVDEGKSLFESIERVHKLRPRIEHYGCMVDLLGRAGSLEEAKGLIEQMPVKPNAVVWGALLNACRIHKNVELGTKIGKLLVEEDPDHGGRYVHLASIHAAAGEWDRAVETRRQMKERGVSKLPGCSAISLDGVVHEFLAGTESHPQAKQIYRAWDSIAERLEKEGYKPALQNLLLDLDDEAKELAITQHSEKLAIAFGLLRTKPGFPMTIGRGETALWLTDERTLVVTVAVVEGVLECRRGRISSCKLFRLMIQLNIEKLDLISLQKMSLKSFMRELKEMKDGIGSISKRGEQSKLWRSRTRSHVAPDEAPLEPELEEQSPWANLPPELLLDIIQRVEGSETAWPARAVVVFCAAVCRSWREITKEIVKTPEQCGRITFPISLKQLRERVTNCCWQPERPSNVYVGKLRSNFLGTKFTIYDSQSPCDSIIPLTARPSCRSHSKQVSPRLPACNYSIGTVTYELNVLRTRGPRRMHCIVHSIPISSIQGGTAPPSALPKSFEEQLSPLHSSKGKEPILDTILPSLPARPVSSPDSAEPLALKNKAPRWHEQLQCWCLNFKGRVTVASVKNFQLVAAVEPSHNVSPEEQEKVILQFGKFGKDIFTMDYRYPLSAFQAFAISLSCFDTKPACE